MRKPRSTGEESAPMQQQQQQWYILGRVGVCECGRQHGQRVRKDDHADDDGHDHRHKPASGMRVNIAVTGSGHGDDGEVQRRHVAIARCLVVRVSMYDHPAVRVTAKRTQPRTVCYMCSSYAVRNIGVKTFLKKNFKNVKNVNT